MALASIVLQAIVLGTHLHPEARKTSPAFASAQGQHERRQLPAPARPTGDDCAICFALQLAAASPLPDSPASPLAQSDEIAFASFGDPLDLPLLPYLHFRTRAPPIVEVDKASV
jgi:hypothetical protein